MPRNCMTTVFAFLPCLPPAAILPPRPPALPPVSPRCQTTLVCCSYLDLHEVISSQSLQLMMYRSQKTCCEGTWPRSARPSTTLSAHGVCWPIVVAPVNHWAEIEHKHRASSHPSVFLRCFFLSAFLDSLHLECHQMPVA